MLIHVNSLLPFKHLHSLKSNSNYVKIPLFALSLILSNRKILNNTIIIDYNMIIIFN